MKNLVYINENTEGQEIKTVFEYLKENNLSNNLDVLKSPQWLDQYVEENLNTLKQTYDTITIYNLRYFSSLVRAVETMQKLANMGIKIHFSKYHYASEAALTPQNLIDFFDRASDDISISSSLSRWPMHYKKPGRPKGSKNKTLMLDRFKKEIEQYIDQGFSYSTISNLVKCHPQTLKSWLHNQEQEHIETV